MERRIVIVDMQIGLGASEIQLRQGDRGIPLEFSVFEGGKGVDLADWKTCVLDVQDEYGEPITSIPCVMGEGTATCKVDAETTKNAGTLVGNLVLENDDARVSSEDIVITVIGSRKVPEPVKTTSTGEQSAYESSRRAFEDAKELLDGLMVEAEASRGNYDGARKLLEEAKQTYDTATKAREDGMKILGRSVLDLEEARKALKDKTEESANATLLLTKAAEEKRAAETTCRRTMEELEKRLEELKQYKPQEATKEATEAPEAATQALAIASSTRKTVEGLTAALDELKATVVSLALRKEV